MDKENVNGSAETGDELNEIEEVQDVEGNDITDWKDLAIKRDGTAKRYRTQQKKIKEEFESYKKTHPDTPKEPDKPQDKKDFDLAEESYLLARGIKENEFDLVFSETSKSGKSIKEVLGSKWFQEELETKRSQSAIPSGSKRSGGGLQDETSYWINKGAFPPNTPENKELRRKVANELAKRHSDNSKFSPNPIV
ncbi:MAG: hypothetical protein PHW73_02250 [Atribacterota bacterium]|nr:hypothetical protein [Atribacterota bacterium]